MISSSRAQRPDERIEAVGERLAEHEHVRRHAEMLDRPQLAGAEETHLDLVDDQQDAVLVEHLLQAREEVRRRDHVAAGALDRLDVERGVFALPRLRVPHAVVFGLEQALELRARSARRIPPCVMPFGPRKWYGNGDELRAIAK